MRSIRQKKKHFLILTNLLNPKFSLIFNTQHKVHYCGKFFTMKNKNYRYDEAGFEFVNNEFCSVIKFSSGKEKFIMREELFFSKVDKNNF